MGLFDAEGQSHNSVYALHRFMLGIYCMTVGRSCKGKRVLPNPWHKRLGHINNLRKRRLSTIMLLSQSDLQSRYLLCISHFQLLPAPPPRATAGHFPALSVPGEGDLQILCCPGTGRLLTPGPFPSFWYALGFLSEYKYTEDFTGKEIRFAHLSRTWINWRGL